MIGTGLAVAVAMASLGAAVPGETMQPGGQMVTRVAVRTGAAGPLTPDAARRLVARLEVAAMKACGAETYSVPQLRDATRASACWREAMAGAVARVGDPQVAQAFADGSRAE